MDFFIKGSVIMDYELVFYPGNNILKFKTP